MNTDEANDEGERLWSYIHGVLEAGAEKELEDDLRSNPELAEELGAMQRLDREFRLLGQAARLTEDDLEQSILSAMEADAAALRSAEARTVVRPVRLPGAGEFFDWIYDTVCRPWAYRAAFAVAASLLILLGARNYASSPLEWGGSEFITMQYRGVDSDAVLPAYSPDELRQFSATLRTAIRRSYQEQRGESVRRSLFAKNTEWIVISKWQELRAESLYVQVEAYDPRHKTLVREWAELFPDAAVFLSDVERFGADIAKDLASIGTVGQESQTF